MLACRQNYCIGNPLRLGKLNTWRPHWRKETLDARQSSHFLPLASPRQPAYHSCSQKSHSSSLSISPRLPFFILCARLPAVVCQSSPFHISAVFPSQLLHKPKVLSFCFPNPSLYMDFSGVKYFAILSLPVTLEKQPTHLLPSTACSTNNCFSPINIQPHKPSPTLPPPPPPTPPPFPTFSTIDHLSIDLLLIFERLPRSWNRVCSCGNRTFCSPHPISSTSTPRST